jgi:hypothetical protein
MTLYVWKRHVHTVGATVEARGQRPETIGKMPAVRCQRPGMMKYVWKRHVHTVGATVEARCQMPETIGKRPASTDTHQQIC